MSFSGQCAANGSSIQTFGRRSVKVELGLANPFTWNFTIADVTKPTFQRFMDNVFHDMQFVYVYLDDILVASSSTDEHCILLRQLFERLAEYGLVVNLQKCVLGQ